MVIDLDHVWVQFEYQGHCVKVKDIQRKLVICEPRHQFHLLLLIY